MIYKDTYFLGFSIYTDLKPLWLPYLSVLLFPHIKIPYNAYKCFLHVGVLFFQLRWLFFLQFSCFFGVNSWIYYSVIFWERRDQAMPFLVTLKHVNAESSMLAKGGHIKDCQCFHYRSYPLRMLRVLYAEAWRGAAFFTKV